MPSYHCRVDVYPKEGIHDPAGEAVRKHLPMAEPGLTDRVSGFRMGKFFEIEVDFPDHDEAARVIDSVAANFLANTILEAYSVTITPVEVAELQ
jgi:phosphoribosylformylglycinamidine synthase PurS subunit